MKSKREDSESSFFGYNGDMRLFIAVLPDEEAVKELITMQNELYSQGIRGRYLAEENLHLTMTFIGEYPDPDTILDLMEEVPFEPYEIRITSPYCHNNIWRAGVECPEEAEKYVKALRHQLADHSVPFSPQKFVPHITLIRGAKGTLRDSIAGNDVSMTVKAVCLMRSDRGKTGMNYTEIGRVEVV